MGDNLENFIKRIYKNWKKDKTSIGGKHPDEEMFVCFFEDRLSKEEAERLKAHLISCKRCLEIVDVQMKLKTSQAESVPLELMDWAKGLLVSQEKSPVLEVLLKLKDDLLELLNATGDVLLGQELVPAAILRSRSIKDFKDEITILKDFGEIRVELRLENKGNRTFNAVVLVKEKNTQKSIKNLRISLIKDGIELESYLNDTGAVIFEQVSLGKFKIEISSIEEKIASVLLDVEA